MGDFFRNLFPGCIKMSAQQPFESSLQEENSPDVNGDDLVKELLFYFRGFQYFNDTEDKIKQICYIKEDKTKVWSLDEIKKAWEEAKSLGKKEKKYWSHVILLQELKRVCHNNGKRSMPGNVLEEDVDCVKGSRKRRTSNRSLDRNTELADDTSQTAKGFQNLHSQITEEQIGEDLNQQLRHILIPLSAMSENEPTTIQDAGDTNSTPYTKYKFPSRINNPSMNGIKKRKSYVMSFNNDTKNADWVYEILNVSTLANNCLELKFEDTNYDKGHLAAAANHRWCLEAKNDASLFSNLAPQHHELNMGTWKKLEKYCQDKTKKMTVRNVHVYTGPLYDNLIKKREGGKALPSHLFKVIIVENDNGTVEEPECYVFPNERPTWRTIKEYKVDIKDLQKKSRLTFIYSSPGVTQDRIKTIMCQGKNEYEQECTADIKVRISS